MKKVIIAVTLALSTLFAGMGVVLGSHSWSGYHWTSDNLSPTVFDKTKADLYDVSAAVSEWASLSTSTQPVISSNRKSNIVVSEAGSAFWLGLARIWIDEDGHIGKGEVKLNTSLLVNYGPAAADHILCQELGHILGLNHQRGTLDSCMNDQAPLGSVVSPNAHDAEQLALIYDHEDVIVDDGDGKGRGNGRGGKKRGEWVVVHTTPIP